MGYDRGDSFPLDFEPNGIPFGSLSPQSYPIHYERKWKYSFVSVAFFYSRQGTPPEAFNTLSY